jgi:integrase
MAERLKGSLRTNTDIRALLTKLAPLPASYDKVHFDSDLPGYGLRVRGSGVHSLMVQYAIAGKTRRIVLGKFGNTDLGKAYRDGKDLLAKVRLGGDPAAEKDQARVRASETFGALLPTYLERQQARMKPRSYAETGRHLERHAKALHRLPIESITRRTIAAQLTKIAKQNGPTAANRTRASLSGFFTWAAREGYRDDNPVSFTNKAVENGVRERTPSDEELRTIWLALDDDPYGAILKLLMLTSTRADEIGGLEWTEVSPTLPLITLPPRRTKNKREHLIPLSKPAHAIVMAQPRTNPDGTPRKHVFGNGKYGYRNWSKDKLKLDARITQARHGKALEHWTPHDFRRSISTALHERFGVPPHVVEVLLGHAGGHKAGVAGTYNKAIYLEERRRALEQWGTHIMTLVGKPTKARVA